MSTEKTLSIIKPDATSRNIIGKIISRFEENNLKVSALKLIQLTQEDAAAFYSEHKGKPFFDKLVSYMISSPIVVQVLEGENAVKRNRAKRRLREAGKIVLKEIGIKKTNYIFIARKDTTIKVKFSDLCNDIESGIKRIYSLEKGK